VGKPPWGLSSVQVGFGFVAGTEYVTCADPAACDPVVKVNKPLNGANNGYHDLHQYTIPEADGSVSFGYIQTGEIFGSVATAGAHIRTGWYLNNENNKVGYNTNSCYAETVDNEARVARGTSILWAPHGPFTVCITENTEAGTARLILILHRQTSAFLDMAILLAKIILSWLRRAMKVFPRPRLIR